LGRQSPGTIEPEHGNLVVLRGAIQHLINIVETSNVGGIFLRALGLAILWIIPRLRGTRFW